MDSVSEKRLSEVHPILAAKVREMADLLAQDGPPVVIRVTQGLRSWTEQSRLYAQGRTAPGQIVTMARPGSSWHNFGLAVDVVPLTELGPDWNTAHPAWKRIVEVAEGVGLVTGAEFRTFPDYPHVQLTGSWPVSPTDEAAKVYGVSGMSGVWERSGLSKPV